MRPSKWPNNSGYIKKAIFILSALDRNKLAMEAYAGRGISWRKCLWSKNNCYLFERLFKVKKNGVFLFGISFFVLEIFTFLYYANEESDDVIGGSTKTAQHSIENNPRNMKNLAPAMYITKETEWHQLGCCYGNILGSSLSLWKTKYPHLQPFKVGQRVLLGTHMVSILS